MREAPSRAASRRQRALAAVSCGFWLLVGAACDGDGDRPARPCSSARACDGQACVADLAQAPDDLAALPLVCGEPVGPRAARAACERASDCASGVCALAGACVRPCAEATDCGERERCQALYARGADERLHTLEACVAMVDLPADAEVAIEHVPDAFSGGIDSLALPPAEASAALYVIEHTGDHSWPVPSPSSSCRPPLCARRLESPGGDTAEPLFDRDRLDDPAGPRNPIAIGDHVNPLVVALPNGPRGASAQGGALLEVETKRAGAARITRLSRRPAGGRLDLNVYFVGASGFDADRGELPQLLADVLDEVDRIYEPDVYVGDVRQIRVTGELLERGTPLPDAEASQGFAQIKRQYRVYPQLPELFALSAGAANVALDVFFVADIESLGEGDLGGISGGTPVPLGMHGTPGSGIAIASDMLAGSASELGRVLAHELGHALGLFHTTEHTGQVFDPLPDTPACPLARDARGDGLDAADCSGAGGDNLMFPSTDATASVLTPDQRAVLRAAPILQ